MTVLIVEDELARAKELKKFLQSKSVHVALAEDGYEAKLKLKTEKFDLILSDCNMIGMDGYQLANEVKKDEDTKNIPFLMYSSRPMPAYSRELALDMGANKVLDQTDISGIGTAALAYLKTHIA